MEDHPTLSDNIPRIAPPRMHARKPSRSPTRSRLGDDLLADLSPATTLEAFTSPSGKLKASIEAATPSERAFGLRATLASKKIQEWVTELSDWPWPTEGGSVGFEIPTAKRRKLTNSSTELCNTHNGFEGSAGQNGDEPPYVGSLLAAQVERYEDRIDEITDEMDDLNVEDIKRQVLDTHFSPKSRPSSSASNAPPMPSLFASYTKMDDFTAVVTATVLQALPNLSHLMRLIDVWTIRLNILQKVPPLLGALDEAERALRSGWNIIRNPEKDQLSGKMFTEELIVSRQTFLAIMETLQWKVTNLGKDLDFMLDTLEGREDTLPDSWLDRMDLIERDYGEWVVACDRKVREGEWAIVEKKRREEEEARRLKEVEVTRLKAEHEASEVARLKALRDGAKTEAPRLETVAKEAARIEAEEQALEAARCGALRQAEISESTRIEAELEAQEMAKREAEELETTKLQALREAEIAKAAKIETARIEAEREVQEFARKKAVEEALEASRLETLRQAEIAEAARTEAATIEAARLEAERKAQDDARRGAEGKALEVARLEASRVAEYAGIEAARAEAEREAEEIARQRAEEEELATARALEEAEAARVEAERRAQDSARRQADAEALEVIRLQALEEAEATRLKVEYETQVLAARKAEEEILEAARLKALRHSEEAEAMRLKAIQEAEESARQKAEFEAAESKRIKLETETLELAQIGALQEAEEAEIMKLKFEQDARDLAHQKAEFEAAKIERRRVEQEIADAEKLRVEQDLKQAKRLRVEQDAQEVARLKAERRFEEARALETVRLQAEKDAREARQRAERQTESRRIQGEKDALKAARVQAEKEALRFERVRAQEAELAHQNAEQDAITAAKLKAEQDTEHLRPNAEREAQELTRLQALRDAEAAETLRLQEVKEAEIQRLQAEKEANDIREHKRTAELAQIRIKEAGEAIRLQVIKDAKDAARLRVEQDAEIARLQAEKDDARLADQQALNAKIARQDELSRQQAAEAIRLTGVVKQDEERESELAREISQQHLDNSHPFKLSRQESVSVAGTETVEQPATGPAIKSSRPVENVVAPKFNNPVQAASIGVVPSTIAVGLSIASLAFLCNSTEETSPVPAQHNDGSPSENLHSGGPAFNASSGGLSQSRDAPDASDEKLDMPQEMILDSGIDSPIKFDATEPQTPSLGSPIHFDHQYEAQMALPLKEAPFSQLPLIDTSDSPKQETQPPLINFTSQSPKVSDFPDPQEHDSTQESFPQLKKSKVLDTAPLPSSKSSSKVRPMYDGANDPVDPSHCSNSVSTGWIVINTTDSEDDQEVVSLQDSSLPDAVFKLNSQSEKIGSLQIQNRGDELLSSYIEANPAIETSETEPAKHLPLTQTPVETTAGKNFSSEAKPSAKPPKLPQSTTEEGTADSFVTPSKFSQSSHDLEEVEDASNILSPVPEEELMPSIEVDCLDGSCAACDSYVQGGDEDAPPARTRIASVGCFDTSMRRASRSHRDSISSDTSTIINSRISEDPSSPIASPQLDSSFLDSFPEDVEQSPSAGRIGHRSHNSYELSPPPSPSATPRLSKQRSLQVLRTSGFGYHDPTAPATPLEAPAFDNLDVTAAPLLASPRKASNDEQLQQQISSLLETIPARIRLTSDTASTPFASQAMRPKKTRRSVTPSFRPSSSMSNYSTYSRAPTPSFTLAPAFSKTTQRSRGSVGNPEIKLYHLSRSTGEAPIKLFVRLVGENGERVMVRVGGGWADLGEYLKEYASHHGRRSTLEGGERIEIQDLPSRVVSGSSVSSNTTIRDSGRATPFSRPSSVMGNHPGSSLNIRKTRKSIGPTETVRVPSRVSDIRNEDRSPSTPLPSINRRSYETPPSAASVASSSPSGTGPSIASGRSSRLSWGEEDSSLGLAGPKAKKFAISDRDQEWVESMKENVKLASAEKERRTRESERLDRERERKTSFGEMDKVGATKRLFRKSLAEKLSAQKGDKSAPG